MNRDIPGTDTPWGIWIWLFAAASGFIFHAKQCQLADYYRNIHLYFIKGESGSELDNFAKLRSELHSLTWRNDGVWMVFLYFYGNYTKAQEKMTPAFQQFKQLIDARFGRKLPAPLCAKFRTGSLPLMKWANILTFNTRAIALYISLLIGEPWLYLVFEVFVMNVIFIYMRAKHEALCRKLSEEYA